MHTYVFVLGAVPALAEAEVRHLLDNSNAQISRSGSELRIITSTPINTGVLMQRLGGVIRIDEQVGQISEDSTQYIAEYLHNQIPDGKIQFGITGGGKKLGLVIKKKLKSKGRSVRYVQIQNSASIVHNGLVDRKSHVIVRGNGLFVTVAVHDFEGLAKQDEERPGMDSVSGMLPPKLARMMINIAGPDARTLLDPFCGSGTVLMEAAKIGYETVYGTDISGQAIEDTKKNMAWLDSHGVAVDTVVAQSDVRQVSGTLSGVTVDCIVSEPFMGAPKRGNERKDTLEREAKTLAALFAVSLEQFAKMLPSGGAVVFSKPRFRYHDTWVTIDWTQALAETGFIVDPVLPGEDWLLYAREGQHVGREIWKLRKQ